MKVLRFRLIGRFGNLLFIYAHARAWAEQNGYQLCVEPWIGEKVFNIPEALRPGQCAVDLDWPEQLFQHGRDLNYTRKQVREWFKIKPDIETQLQAARCDKKALFNLRERDDYLRAGLVVISRASYLYAAQELCPDLDRNDIGIESDENPTRLPHFRGNIDASGLGTTAVALPSFYRLMTAPILFRANSTFSWWAATLGHGRVFSPVIRALPGGIPGVPCPCWVEGNWPVMADCPDNSDLHLPEE